jgi:alpha-glucoside transport system permease protein
MSVAPPDTLEPETRRPATGPPESTWRRIIGRWPLRIVVILIVAIWLVPTVGLLISSFRTQAVSTTEGWWTFFARPFDFTQWTIANYDVVLTQRGFANAFAKSLAVAIPSTIIPITVAAFAAYAFAWMEFRGRNTLFVFVVALLVIPLHMSLIPILRLYSQGASLLGVPIFPNLGLVGTFPAMWLAHAGFALPLAIYLLRNYLGSLPSELMESARVDGATHFETFTRLVVPLSVPALAAFATLQFLWVWNDFLVAMVFLGGTPDVAVLTVALANMQGQFGQLRHLMPAAAFVSMALPMVVFFSLQRFFVRGLTAGAVKG